MNARSLLSRLTLSATPQSYSCLPITLEQHISPQHVLSNTPQHLCLPIFIQFLSEALIINHVRHKSCKFKERYLTLFIFPSFVRNIKWEMKATPSYLSDPSKAMQEAHTSLTLNNQNKTETEQHREPCWLFPKALWFEDSTVGSCHLHMSDPSPLPYTQQESYVDPTEDSILWEHNLCCHIFWIFQFG